MYVELKTGYADNGPAWIGRVRFSKSGSSVYYRGRELLRANVIGGNYLEVETRDEYWISGVKNNGQDRRARARGAAVEIDPDAADEYRRIMDAERQFAVADSQSHTPWGARAEAVLR